MIPWNIALSVNNRKTDIMRLRIDWKKVVIFAIVSGGLLYITESSLMTLGIILLLFVADYFVGEWERRHKGDEQ